MKKNFFKSYVTKVEDKYVFNLSTIFWHLIIAITSIAIIVSIALFLWSVVPPMKKKVEKAAYPAEKPYPAPVKVSIEELLLADKTITPAPRPVEAIADTASVVKAKEQVPIEDIRGKTEYTNSLNVLKSLIPPAKYSWEGDGYWSYPYGEMYWNYYHQERYRQWNITEPGLEDKLDRSYRHTKANNYTDKKTLLDAYIMVIKPMKEELRLGAMQSLLNNLSESIDMNVTACKTVSTVAAKMSSGPDSWFIGNLVGFILNNPKDGVKFCEYVEKSIDKFDSGNRPDVLNTLINAYYGFFGQDLKKFQESTDLFYPFLKQIKSENQNQQLNHYYQIFSKKNQARDEQIAQIINEYNEAVQNIDAQYDTDKMSAELKYESAKIKKSEWRYKSLIGVGGGIVIIVLIGTILAFLSIQRSVRKIEDKLTEESAGKS